MKTENTLCLDIFHSCLPVNADPRPFVSRGQVLSGVLDGIASYESIPVFSDVSSDDMDGDIDYDPANDQRLDRFDGVELGVEAMDAATAPPVEKKE